MTSELMPAGKPNYLQVIKYPMIRDLVKEKGHREMLAVLVIMVKDFCSSLNVVRNMNEDQMIEAAAMLLDECDNFRMEDYLMMFAMAKKGNFYPEVKIYDRIDIQLIATIMDCFWERRKAAAAVEHENELQRLDSIGNTSRQIELMNPADAKLTKATEGLATALDDLKTAFVKPMSEQEALKDIHRPRVSYRYGEDEQGNKGFIKQDDSEK